ncbi:MAG: 1-pyrroline-5-carboxylate dehydrogenase [Paraburkholderia tropica]
MIEQIEKHLAGEAEATAKEIANALGARQLDVSKALHQMVATGTVEREKRVGGGNEYMYWLARGALPALAEPPSVEYSIEQKPMDVTVVGMIDAKTVSDLRADVARLTSERDAAMAKAETWRANAAALEARIDELTLGPPGAAAPLFVTIGRDAPPKRHSSLEKAQRRGAALIRAYKETEVLVLEPVGRIVRGSEWRPR